MTLQDQIAALCAEAEPLRGRVDGGGDELRVLVERINALRAVEASVGIEDPTNPASGLSQVLEIIDAPKRRGRPPKVTNA